MKQVSLLRSFAANRVAFTLAGTLLLTAALAGCGGTSGTQSAFAPTQSTFAPMQSASASARALVQPPCAYGSCYREFAVLPRGATIKLNQKITFIAVMLDCFNGQCNIRRRVDATWHSSGGSLKVKGGRQEGSGKRATFWASLPGQYRVSAWHAKLYAAAYVTVTSP